MESYDLDETTIIDWAVNFATFEELERTAKALYGVYVETRKKTAPEAQKRARMANKKLERGRR